VAKIRVLIVDDSVVIRRLVAVELARDPAIEVAGCAPNGRIALARLPELCPDLVILDIEMPVLNGLETLKALRKTYPKLPVIMFSSLTECGAAASLEALALGATDYFAKPTCVGGLEGSLRVIREELIPAIKAICAPPTRRRPIVIALPHRGFAVPGTVRVLAIGASTGGPNALAALFEQFPADFPVPIVVVQHMPPMFTKFLADRLSDRSPIRVVEAADGATLVPGMAWIAPGGHHMVVEADGPDHRLAIHQEPPENSCRPAVDVLLRSVARTFGPDSLTLILTGMGQDGLRGAVAIREAGGQVLAQDEASSVVWGMPGAVARAGLADAVLPLDAIAAEVLKRVRGRTS
jgi:two-component system chemotaxis response regulator CheB